MLLLLVAGSIGVWIVPAAERGNALREWRWLIVEPLIFYGLVRWNLWHQQQNQQHQRRDRLRFALVWGLVIGGGLVGLVGILQYWGINLAPHIGDEVGFGQDVLVVEGVKRVNSVYGHANNLALTMGRVWALAGVLALAYVEGQRKWVAVLAGVLCLFALGGLYVAFSKGANLGVLAGVLFLLAAQVGLILRGGDASARQRVVPLVVLLVIVLFVMASGMRVERLQLMGASSHVRLMTWASAWEIIQAHPLLGLGLDQFNRVYQQVMHPSLVGTTEQYISHPHNLLFDLWLRVGMLGIVAFAWLLVRFFRRIGGVLFLGEGAAELALGRDSRVRLLYAGAGAAMLASIVHGMVDNWYFVPDLAIAFWLMIAVVE
jgi:O-antigen ligase